MSAFFEMGGYAAFVWPSYAIALGVAAGLLVHAVRAHGRAKARLEALEAEKDR
jgi:heme exporter protein D